MVDGLTTEVAVIPGRSQSIGPATACTGVLEGARVVIADDGTG